MLFCRQQAMLTRALPLIKALAWTSPAPTSKSSVILPPHYLQTLLPPPDPITCRELAPALTTESRVHLDYIHLDGRHPMAHDLPRTQSSPRRHLRRRREALA